MTKVLTICRMGVVRSATLMWLLKTRGYDAVAVGFDFNSPETMRYMCEWADKIIPLMEGYQEYVPGEYWHKMKVFDVGEDVYGIHHNPVLIDKLKDLIKENKEWLKS